MTPEEAQKALEEARRLRLENAYRQVLQTEAGRLVLWDLINREAGVLRECFSAEETHRSAYLEGRRSVGLSLVGIVQRVSPSDWLHMVTEASERNERDRLEREQAIEKKEQAHGG